MLTFAQPTPTISYLAGNLLRAWVRADRNQLQTELDRSALASLCIQNEGEEERLELLQTVAARMSLLSIPAVFTLGRPRARFVRGFARASGRTNHLLQL